MPENPEPRTENRKPKTIYKPLTFVFLISTILFSVLFILLALGTATMDEEHVTDYNKLLANYSNLYDDYIVLADKEESLVSDYNYLLATHEEIYDEYQEMLETESLEPPYIHVFNRTVLITFYRIDDSIETWEVPFSSLDNHMNKGRLRRQYIPELFIPLVVELDEAIDPLCEFTDCTDIEITFDSSLLELQGNSLNYVELEDDNGKVIFRVMEFTSFVEPDVFIPVMEELFEEAETDRDFISEVWNIVTQLNTYSRDIEETPRYPLETLLAGGGDCEDTSILLASMLKAAPVDWLIELVYIDSNNPDDPQDINHVIVHVDTGSENYLIETTSSWMMEPYETVTGWYFEV